MTYEVALHKAWQGLRQAGMEKRHLQFLHHELEVDAGAETIKVLSGGAAFRDYHEVLILHYLEGEAHVSAIDRDKWISFKELPGGEFYFSAFRKRAIAPLLQKFGGDVKALTGAAAFLEAEPIDYGTVGVAVRVFAKIRLGIVLWEADEEFAAECSILLNDSVRHILPTEDIAVMAGIAAGSL
jgi:hypothetical protein